MYKEKIKTAEQVYDELSEQGLYEEANLDKLEIQKILNICIEDYEFAQRLKNIDKPNFRVIFNVHYDILRELCSALMKFKKQKISNHQGLFAFISLEFKDLDFDWKFFETQKNH